MAADEDEDEDEAVGVEEDDGEGGGPGRVAKSERILNLIAVLLRADGPVPVTDILGKVTGYDDKASRDSLMRRFERDKKVLREMGVPIEHAPAGPFGGEGYTISRDAFFLDEVRLPPESGTILRALFAWAHAGGGELSADLRAALVKLGYFVEDDGQTAQPARARELLVEAQARPAARRGDTVDPKLAPAATVGKNLELLSEAVMRQRRVKLKYYSYTRDEETVREVDPYGLGYAGQAWNPGRGAWYLVGWCHWRKDVRCFKVSRIRGEVAFVKGTDEPDFQIPAGFRVREHVGKTRWEFQDLAAAFEGKADAPFTARVRFEAAVATEVRALAPSARVVARDAERETLELAVKSRRPFLRFLLRYVPGVEVLEPPDLEDDLRALAREVLALYEAPTTGGAR